MLFTSATELRFYFPTHAIDTLDPFIGIIDNSEHDFLQEKLGTPLYNKLCQWYEQNTPVGAIEPTQSPEKLTKDGAYSQLLLLSQRCVAYDAFSRAIEFGIVSPNNGGINVPTSDDYGKVDLAAVEKFRLRCVTEAHAAVNRLLQILEDWCKKYDKQDNQESSDNSANSEASELQEIVTLWQQSRYYYLAAGMLIPSARILQEYLNIYDSREKFIQMLPDLRFLQEEVLAPAIGEDLCAYLVEFATTGKIPNVEETAESADTAESNSQFSILNSQLKKARKYLAAALENRTLVLKTDKLRRQQAHDEAVRLLASIQQFIADHQDAFPENVIKTSPLYTPPPTATPLPADSQPGSVECPAPSRQEKEFKNNRRGSAMFVTPMLD